MNANELQNEVNPQDEMRELALVELDWVGGGNGGHLAGGVGGAPSPELVS